VAGRGRINFFACSAGTCFCIQRRTQRNGKAPK
jgi:hypothetical protein